MNNSEMLEKLLAYLDKAKEERDRDEIVMAQTEGLRDLYKLALLAVIAFEGIVLCLIGAFK